MKHLFKTLLASLLLVFVGCKSTTNETAKFISDDTIKNTLEEVKKAKLECDFALVEKGVNQAAALWKMEDGTQEEFKTLIVKNYAKTPEEKEYLFSRICYIMERLYGTSNQLTVELQKPLHLAGADPIEVDYLMGSYTPFSHLSDDLIGTRFYIVRNIKFCLQVTALGEAHILTVYPNISGRVDTIEVEEGAHVIPTLGEGEGAAI